MEIIKQTQKRNTRKPVHQQKSNTALGHVARRRKPPNQRLPNESLLALPANAKRTTPIRRR